MRTKTTLWDWILKDAENGSGGGGGEGGQGAGGSQENGGDQGGGEQNGGDQGNAGGQENGGEGGSSAYRPEGLPDNLYGESDQETLDKMALALKGYRDKDNQRGVPTAPEAYAEFGDNIPDPLKPHVGALADDTVFQKLSKSALDKGMSVQDFQGLTLEFFGAAQEMGVLEPFVDVDAEKAALVPEDAKNLSEAEQTAAREKRMNDNFAFLDAMTANGEGEGQSGMSQDVADFAKSMLGDSAKGHQFIEHMRSQISGGSSKLAGGSQGSGGADPKADIFRREQLPENTPGDPKFNKESYDQLQADYQKVYG